MATYNDEKYASSGVGNAGLTLGVIGTALASGILGNNGVTGIFGNRSAVNECSALAIAQKDAEIAQLKAERSTDAKIADVYTSLRNQDNAQDSVISGLKDRIAALEVAAPLREQIVLGKVQEVANSVACLSANTQAQLSCITATLSGITKTIVPASAVCPKPMPLHNSWTATAVSASAGAA